MNKRQLGLLYGPESPYYHEDTLRRLLNMSKSIIHNHLEKEITAISNMDKFEIRLNDIVLSRGVFMSNWNWFLNYSHLTFAARFSSRNGIQPLYCAFAASLKCKLEFLTLLLVRVSATHPQSIGQFYTQAFNIHKT